MSMKPNKNRNENTKLTNGGKEVPFPKVGIAKKMNCNLDKILIV